MLDRTNWYTLYTAPRAEKKVNERLLQSNIKAFLPLLLQRKKWSDRVKLIEEPLFKSYIFVSCSECELFDCLKIQGVSRVVYYCGKPAVVRFCEIMQIKKFLKQAKGASLITEGDDVEIVDNALKTYNGYLSGKVKKIKGKYLYLQLDQLNAKITVRLNQAVKIN